MISYLKGTLRHKSPGFILIEVGGVGFAVNLSLADFEDLPPEGEKIKVYTYLHLKENGLSLYGFLKEEERELFLHLISLSNIGPKSALRILSKSSPSQLKRAIGKADLGALTRIPGIGKKTAQRLILELRGKIGVEEEKEVESGKEEMIRDALSALVNLGYTRTEAREAVKKALKVCPEKTDLTKLIKESLKYI